MLIAVMASIPALPVVESLQTSARMTLDGVLDEPAWNTAQKLHLKNNASGEAIEDESFSSYALVTHDTENLYIAFVNRDRHMWSTFENRDDHLWENEVVEVFIDTDADLSTYVELEVAPTNVVFDSFITDTLNIDLVVTPRFELAGWKTAISAEGTVNDSTDIDTGWTVEMSMPFHSLLADYTPARLGSYAWKINFYRIDRDADGPRSYAWSPTYKRFHTPSRFGTIVFR